MKRLFISFLYIICSIFQISLQREYLISQEFTDKTFGVASLSNWSVQKVGTCNTTNFIDFSQLSMVGILGMKVNQTRIYTGLPPHWSLSLRFDMVLIQSFDPPADYVNVYIDKALQGQFTKNPSQGVSLCVTSSWADMVVLYSKNVTHTSTSAQIDILTFTDEAPPNEGVVIRNLFLYVDECHISCASCSGPTENQCLTCPSNSTLLSGKCTCNIGFNQDSHSCVSTCATNYIQSKNGSTCIQDPCLNCASCDTTNQICNTCNSGYNLYQGTCVTSCPLTAPLSGSKCIDFSSSLTNGKYLVNGLSNNSFGESEIKGMGLSVAGFQGFYTYTPTGAFTTNCGQIHLLGGAFLAAKGSSISGSWSSIAPHWSIKVGFSLYFIDSWDTEKLTFKIDNTLYKDFVYVYTSSPSNLCGININDGIQQYSTNITHTSTSLKLDFIVGLDEDEFNESFGMRDLYVLIDYCPSNCSSCDASGCLTCNAGYYLYYKRCYNPCPSNTFVSGSNCVDCNSTCATCTSATDCTSCTSPYYKNPGTGLVCKTTCPDGYWADSSNYTCNSCDSTCYTCESPGSSSSCLTCSGSNYLYLNQCIQTCPNGYYKSTVTNNNKCLKCNPSCLTCDGNGSSSCLSCLLPLYYQTAPKTCVSSCNSNQYGENSNATCTACDSTCATCVGALSINCSSCSGSTYLNTLTNQCVANCPQGYYNDSASHTCLVCHSSCKTCNGALNNNCTSCTLPLYYQSSENKCVSTCYTNQYQDNSVPSCNNCDSSCTTCFGSLNSNCSSCSGTLFLDTATKKCVSQCPDGFYNNTTNHICTLCDTTCTTCNNGTSNSCINCTLPRYYQLSTTSCDTTCHLNQYKDDSTATCQPCHSTCASCSGPNPNQCLTCSGSLYLDSQIHECVSICPDGYYSEISDNTCTLCNSTCTTCNNGTANSCIKCTLPRYYQSSTTSCDTTCHFNEYKDDSTATCQPCHSTCASCSGPNQNQCLSCSGSLFLDSLINECVSTCPDGYYSEISDHTCTSCDPSCHTCNNKNPNNCLSCTLPLYYHSSTSTCVNTCDSNQFKNDPTATCDSCNSSCLTCNGSSNLNCLSCANLSYLNSSNSSCVSHCPDGYFDNNSNNTCTLCESTCLTCNKMSSTDCLSCQLPRYFQASQGTCVQNCDSNQYKDGTEIKCIECNSTCNTCSGATDSECLSCSGIRFYYLGKCLEQCPDGFYPDSTDNQCKPCDSSCLTCTDYTPLTCTTCINSKFLENGSCLDNCSPNYYVKLSTNICDKCNITCKTCNGATNKECLTCNANRYLLSNECISECPDRFYKNNMNNTCSQCDNTCFTCTDNSYTSCLSCQRPLILFQNQCLNFCPNDYYLEQSTYSCEKCSKGCKTCTGSKRQQCLSCDTGYDLVQNQCIIQCTNGYYLDNEANTCNQCDKACLTCHGPGYDNCIACSSQYYRFKESCFSECPDTSYINKDVLFQCESCHEFCNGKCTGGSKEDCESIKPQNQLIVYILCGKTLFWIISVLYGFIKDKQSGSSLNQKIKPLPTINLKDQGDQVHFKEMKDPESPTKKSSRILRSKFQHDTQKTTTQNKNELSVIPESQLTFSNVEDDSPVKFRRKRTQRLDFIRSNGSFSTNISSLQITPITSMNTARQSTLIDLPQTQVGSSTIEQSLEENQGNQKQEQAKSQSISANEKLKYSILGNEWLSLFNSSDSYINRPNRSTIIYLKYQMFFIFSELFSMSPIYFITVCLVSGLVGKFIINNLISLLNKHMRYGNMISGVIFCSLIGSVLYLWFIPQLLSLGYAKDLKWSSLYAITFAADFILMQQFFGLIQYLSTIKYINSKDDSTKQKSINKYFKNEYFMNNLTSRNNTKEGSN